MDENLIISENNPELMNLLLGDELYIVHEQKWYANIAHDGNNKHRFLKSVEAEAIAVHMYPPSIPLYSAGSMDTTIIIREMLQK